MKTSAWHRLTRFWDNLFLFGDAARPRGNNPLPAPLRGGRRRGRKPRSSRLAVERLEDRELLSGTGMEEPLLDDPLLDGSASTSDSGSLTTSDGSTLSVSSTSTASLPFYDLFDRADTSGLEGDLGGAWVDRLGDFDLNGNRAKAVGTGFNVATLSGISAADVFVEADVYLSGISTGSGAVVARYAGSGDQNMYAALLVKGSDGAFTGQIWLNLSGSWTQIGSGSVGGVSAGARLRFEVVGTSQRLFVNGALIASAADKAITTAGSVGIRSNANVTFDDFAADRILATTDLPFADSFDLGTSAELGGPWADRLGDFDVQNYRAVPTASGYNLAVLNGVSAADVAVEADVDLSGVTSGSGHTSLLARYGGPADRDMYAALFRKLVDSAGAVTYNCQLWRNVNGTWTRLTDYAYGAETGRLRFEAVGARLRMYFNGLLVGEAEDSSITAAGSVGFRSYGNVAFDNFSAGRLAFAGPLPFADTFDRTDGPSVGPDWTDRAGDFIVSANQAKTSGTYGLTTLNMAPVADVGARADADLAGVANGSCALVARYAGPGDQNMYAALLLKNTDGGTGAVTHLAQLWRNVNGVWTKLTENAVSGGTGELRFEVVGTSLKLYFNGLLVRSTTDSLITAPGLVGLRGIYGNEVFDNFRAADSNQPPVLDPIGNRSVTEEQTLAFTANATDPDASDTLTYSLVNAPAGASIHAQTRAFAWTPTEAQGPGSYTFTVRVTDDSPLSKYDEETITVTVNEANQAPSLDPIPHQTVDEHQTLTFTVKANDPDLPANPLTLTLDGLPGATLTDNGNRTWTVSWTPGEDQDGLRQATVTVSDGQTSAARTITVDVREVNQAPTATSLSQTKWYTEDAVASVALDDIAVSDADPGETLTATLTLSLPQAGSLSVRGGSYPESFCPDAGVWAVTGTAAEVNAALAAVAFAPAADNDRSVTVAVAVRDAAGAGQSGELTLNVTPVNDAPRVQSTTLRYTGADAAGVPVGYLLNDPDTSETWLTVEMTLTDVALGSLSASGWGTYTTQYNASTDRTEGKWTMSGSADDVRKALAQLVFKPDPAFRMQPGTASDGALQYFAQDDAGLVGSGSSGLKFRLRIALNPPDSEAAEPSVWYSGDPGLVSWSVIDSQQAPEAFGVAYALSGSATSGQDYDVIQHKEGGPEVLSGTAQSFFSGYEFHVSPLEDTLTEGTETAVVTFQDSNDYVFVGERSAVIYIRDAGGTTSESPLPPEIPPAASCPPGPTAVAAGQDANPVKAFSEGPVRYFDGTAKVVMADLGSAGFGTPWGHTRHWTNNPGYAAQNVNGNGTVVAELPYLRRGANAAIVIINDGTTARHFDIDPDTGAYRSRFFHAESFTYDAAADEYVFTDTAGNKQRFYSFGANPPGLRGQLKSFTDPAGNAISLTSRTADGKPAEAVRTATAGGVTTAESFLYSYLTTGPNAGLLQSVTLRRQVNDGAWSTVRQVAYDYYDGVAPYGNVGDLKTATVKDAAGAALDTWYYRYYTGEAGGYQGGLKYAFSPASYARLAGDGISVSSATDDQVAPYADLHFEYDAQRRVTREKVQGLGCSCPGTGGLGEYTFSYETSPHADGFNSWKVKTVEKLPDGNENVVYTNFAGEVMLHAFRELDETGNVVREWVSFYEYDDRGRLLLAAAPSAVAGYDHASADLLVKLADNTYDKLHNNAGLLARYTYYTDTTATSTTPGGAEGFLKETRLLRGETDAGVLQQQAQYVSRTAGGDTVFLPGAQTVYSGTGGGGALTTQYRYTFFAGTTAPASVTATYPAVATGQNGPGTADSETTVFDRLGRPVWTRDAGGFLHHVAYDVATGAAVRAITDVDAARRADFADLPCGWVTPAGGGLHLQASFEVDALGRATKATDANGNVDYTVYKDAAHEVRVYTGWNGTAAAGPTLVLRKDRGRRYAETLTMAAQPAALDGSPTGGEPIGSVQSWSRSFVSVAGQPTDRYDYFNLSGASYSATSTPGTENDHFYRTRYAYDHRGRLNRVQAPTGTVYRTVYDALGRPSGAWVGVNDTPASGDWSPTNPAGMVQTSAYAYDHGGVGDGNLTRLTEFPGGTAADRRTDFFHDWRNRLVAVKAGVEATESTDVNRPVLYTEYDNLGRVTASERYDGDGVTVTDGNGDGVPDKPLGDLLRARTTAEYDAQGRLFRSRVFSVDPVTGAVSTTSLATNVWYDRRGLPVKVAAPGGLVTKTAYDGAGRPTATYATDGGGDAGWADAFTVTGDTVLEQAEVRYDGNGNPLQVTTRQRFHDQGELTGPLGTPTSGVRARVSYVGLYYDALDRLTASVDVGTHNGAAWARPGTVPARSDTALVSGATFDAAGRLFETTDPRGTVTRRSYDALGRTTKVVAAYADGVPSAADDRTTEFTYDGAGHLRALKVVLPGGGQQTTAYDYGVRTSTGSGIDSNDVLAAVRHPDPSTGAASSGEQETFTVNALGQARTATDRNGSVHGYGYDALGRLTSDAVTTLGAGVDGQVRRLETSYDSAGLPFRSSSYDAASGGGVVNQVQRTYNGLGQLTHEYQAHAGAVSTASTPKVQYAYSQMAGGANHSRPTSVTYPNGRTVSYHYFFSGVDNRVSRPTSLLEGSLALESYSYLGLGTVARRSQEQPGTELTYVKQAAEPIGDGGDQYTGLDRFGRVVDQRWQKGGVATDRRQYGYDRGGNRLFQANVVNEAFSELYHQGGPTGGYDKLDRLTGFSRGALSDSNGDGVYDSVPVASRSQSWQLDAQGNWASVTTDGATESRTHNQQNEIVSAGGASLAHDRNGNLTTDEQGRQLVYDAWNRAVQVKDAAGLTLAAYRYDALGRRIVETHGAAERHLYYSASWQVLEERDAGNVARTQYVWSPVYVDALLLRDRDADGNGSLEERLYAQHDANFNITALVSSSGTVVERRAYDPYGNATVLTPSWTVQAASGFDWTYGHQGLRLDPAAGWHDNRGRLYSASLGRFAQMDPAGFLAGDTNLYAYVGGSPTNRLDPLGLEDLNLDEIRRRLGSPQRCMACHGSGLLSGRPIGELTPDQQIAIMRWTRTTNPEAAVAVIGRTRESTEAVMSRVQGTSRVIGAVGGAAGAAGAAETGVGIPVAIPLAAWSADQFTTGVEEIWSGRYGHSFGGQVIRSVAGDGMLGCAGEVAYDTLPGLAAPSVSGIRSVPGSALRNGRISLPVIEEPIVGLRLIGGGQNQGWGNIGSHGPVNPSTALGAAGRWIGPGYREIAPGVFRSADGLRQFRMTPRDLIPTHGDIGPHVHFEALNAAGEVIENVHIPISR